MALFIPPLQGSIPTAVAVTAAACLLTACQPPEPPIDRAGKVPTGDGRGYAWPVTECVTEQGERFRFKAETVEAGRAQTCVTDQDGWQRCFESADNVKCRDASALPQDEEER